MHILAILSILINRSNPFQVDQSRNHHSNRALRGAAWQSMQNFIGVAPNVVSDFPFHTLNDIIMSRVQEKPIPYSREEIHFLLGQARM